jgi:thiamine-monophosphate kinase
LTTEPQFIAMMRGIATNSAARGLMDDAAVIAVGTETLIITHDMMVEAVHWLPDANPADVAWKLVASNLSDLASKGARPIGVMLGYMLGEDAWDAAFATGLNDALAYYGVPLLGGDTVKAAGNLDARSIGMTALGLATTAIVPARDGAKDGDGLYVTGTLGDAKAGYDLARLGHSEPVFLLTAFNRPAALLDEGRLLAPIARAMMDISDGLFIDAQRMASASKLAVTIDVSQIPLSSEYAAYYDDTLQSRIDAGSWGDDYQLLFACADNLPLPVAATKVGHFTIGDGLTLMDGETRLDLPTCLGFEHR